MNISSPSSDEPGPDRDGQSRELDDPIRALFDPGPEPDDQSPAPDDPIRALFDPGRPISLAAPPGTFEKISRGARRRRRLASLAATTATAAVVAAVGVVGTQVRRESDEAVSARPSTTAVTTTVTTAVTTAGTATVTTAVTTQAAAPQPCRLEDLSVKFGDGVAGPTRIGLALVVTDDAATTCSLQGYPQVVLLPSVDGHAPLTSRPGGTVLRTDPGPHQVVLRPGESATAGIEWAEDSRACSDTSGAGPAYDKAEITLPGTQGHATVGWPATGCLSGPPAVSALASDAGG